MSPPGFCRCLCVPRERWQTLGGSAGWDRGWDGSRQREQAPVRAWGTFTPLLWVSPGGSSSPQVWLSLGRERWDPGVISHRVSKGGKVSKVGKRRFPQQNFSAC